MSKEAPHARLPSRLSRGDHLVCAAIMVVLGFLLVTSVRVAPHALAGAGIGDPREDLIQVVHELEARKDELERSLAARQLEIASLGAQSTASRDLAEDHSTRIRELSMRAGLLVVHGPGLRITIADNPQPQEFSSDLAGPIVHDYDLRALVNALWAGGAEAIAINGERLTQLSAVRCVGPTVLVNETRLASPFQILAVGDTAALTEALQVDAESRSLINEHTGRFGLLLDVDEAEDLELPAYTSGAAPRESLLGAGT